MTYQPFPILGFESGVKTDVEPWLLPEDALSRLDNAHVFRGRITKRPNTRLLTKIGTKVIGFAVGTPGAGLRLIGFTSGGSIPGAPAVSNMTKIGNAIIDATHTLVPPVTSPVSDKPTSLSVAPYGFRSTAVGQPDPVGAPNVYLLEWNSGTALTQPYTAKINIATGEWFIQLNAADAVFTASADTATFEFYRGLPAMLMTEWVNAVGMKELVVCDTRRLFTWNPSRARLDDELATGAVLATDDVWTGNEFNFFSSASVDDGGARKLVIVNGVNLPKKWTGSALGDMGVSTQFSVAQFVFAQYGIVVYLCPTVGGDSNRQRAMWSDQFMTETVQPANYAVAYTGERIITAAMVQDEIIAVFERSVWKLRYTGDFRVGSQFEWVHLSGGTFDRQDSIGALSPMGVVALSDRLMAVGPHGVIVANGVGGEDATRRVPNLMTDILDPTRMAISYGTVFDQERKAIFSAVSAQADPTSLEPDVALVIDLDTGAVSFYSWSFRIFGLFRKQDAIPDWDDVPWANDLMSTVTAVPGLTTGRPGFPTMIAGTLDGSIYEIPNDVGTDSLGVSTMTAEFRQMNPFLANGLEADFGHLLVYASPVTGGEMKIELWKSHEDHPWRTFVLPLDAPSGKTRIEKLIRVNRTADFHKIRVTQSGSSRWSLDALIPFMQPSNDLGRLT